MTGMRRVFLILGYVVIVTGDSAGNAGDCLINQGGGRAAWGPCP